MLQLIAIGINIILIFALIFVIYSYLLPPLIGAPFVPTGSERVTAMVRLANVRPGERSMDIGSGDGRIVSAFAKAGALAEGCEINPMLVLQSRLSLKRAGARGRIHWKSFRSTDFKGFDIITIYGLPGIMQSLERELYDALPEQGRVISHKFQFPNWKPETREGDILVYLKKPGVLG